MWGPGIGGGSNHCPAPWPARPQATPTADTAMLFFETNRLGFTPEVLGRIRRVGVWHGAGCQLHAVA